MKQSNVAQLFSYIFVINGLQTRTGFAIDGWGKR